jgi:hypothetical protein
MIFNTRPYSHFVKDVFEETFGSDRLGKVAFSYDLTYDKTGSMRGTLKTGEPSELPDRTTVTVENNKTLFRREGSDVQIYAYFDTGVSNNWGAMYADRYTQPLQMEKLK